MIVIIDYDAGNTCSVTNALDRLDVDYLLSDDPDEIRKADKVIFPGVGHAGAAMNALSRKNLIGVIKELTQPVLGICVGMQLLAETSEEGNSTGLGIIKGNIKRFESQQGFKVPHMGWNQVHKEADDYLTATLDDQGYYYFVHSYYMPLNEHTIASCTYNCKFSAIVKKDNYRGIQFHAEKSGDLGSKLLSNFINE